MTRCASAPATDASTADCRKNARRFRTEADHIRSQKHRGPTTLDNLCWACARCNDFKGSDASSYDPVTGELVPLFNPRTDAWGDHFEWRGATLVGKTKSGRASIELLQINRQERVEHRRLLIEAGMFSTAEG